ncbi:hypothetical protein [Streptacidiphilus jiangxiensis]|uniref:Uncharacterized protein n=1 Tax=Streptacidiphilus jiangxiensis TaxID=235985 RepID=A0A1H7RFZ4_STRJI|nr:hypothetical protein [Streptacidiphilus jiangxiensis]SEL59250.1 hypothetical protein SAMN05414137_110116 [Streptacidiphilus jiangxiensis]
MNDHRTSEIPAPDDLSAVPRGRHRRSTTHLDGLPSVPLSVWLTEPLTGCCPLCAGPVVTACARRLPVALVRQITETYSESGDVVWVPDAGNGSLLIGPVTCGRRVIGYARTASALLKEQPTEIASRAVLRHVPPTGLPGQSERLASRAALAILAPHHPATASELAPVLDATVRVVSPGGGVVVVTRQQPGQDRPGLLTAFAQAAGLTYLQHVAAVEASATGGKLRPRTETASHGPDCACPGASARAGRHQVAHHDLLVFTK